MRAFGASRRLLAKIFSARDRCTSPDVRPSIGASGFRILRPMTRAVSCAVFLLAVTATGANGVGAQGLGPNFLTRSNDAVDRAVRWAAAVVGHQPGVRDQEVETIAGWDAPAVADLWIEAFAIRTLVQRPEERAFQLTDNGRGYEVGYSRSQLNRLREAAEAVTRAGLDQSALIARALLLHTDVVFLTDQGGPVLHFTDGRALNLQRGADHLDLARRLAAWLDARSGRLPDVHFWYRATLAAMATTGTWSARQANTAAALAPVDAELLFQAGCVHEMLASPRLQQSIATGGQALPFSATPLIRTTGEELRLAASLLKRAIDAQPGHVDARIHYARVLTLTDRPAEAVRALQRGDADARDPVQQYYIHLLRGGALSALNQIAPARAAYERAAGLFPNAQSPQFGLSELASRSEDRAAATQAMQRVLERRSVDADDPWWSYLQSPGRDSAALMAEARRRLAATKPQALS